MIEKIEKRVQIVRGDKESILVAKVNEIIDYLNANVVQCSCPPWYRDYIQGAYDPTITRDSLYIQGCGWTCPMHGEIQT